jgi:hypothetical protein
LGDFVLAPAWVSPSALKKSMGNIRNYREISENIMKINDLHKLILQDQETEHQTAKGCQWAGML